MNTTGKSSVVGHPRPQSPIVSLAELRPADILLSRGDGRIADLIIEADGGSYSHAALWSGAGIVEATLHGGVAENPPMGRRDVYRYRNRGQELAPEQARKIVDAARVHIGNEYDTAEIHLLGVVFHRGWPRGRPRRSVSSEFLDLFGGRTAARLEEWLQLAYVRSAPRICSELVALAYFEAEQREDGSRPCALLTIAPDQRPTARSEGTTDEEKIDPELAAELKILKISVEERIWSDPRAVERVASARELSEKNARGLMFGHVALDATTETPVGVVTPGDLQFSPSLSFVGVLDAGA